MSSNTNWLAIAEIFAVVLCAGCISGRHGGAALDKSQGMIASTPPSFLTGPASVLLTNANDFRARLVAEPKGGITEPISGNLLQQEGHLLFIPTTDMSARPGSWEGMFRFLFDVSRARGLIISEKIQGYAPFGFPDLALSVISPFPASVPRTEKIQEYACQIAEVTVESHGLGGIPFRVWRAEELNGVPVQIKSLQETNGLTLRLSQVAAEPQAPDLFLTPDGYTKYPDGAAMVNEIVRRQRLQSLRPGGGDGSKAGRRRRY